MSDIDFLANKKPDDDQKSKKPDDKKEKIIWSEPDKDNPLVKEAPFYALPFLNKEKEAKKPASPAGWPAVAPAPAVDKNKIRESRREILKSIKYGKNSKPKEKKRLSKSWLAGLTEKFKKSPSHKEILIDYQQVFNQEKIRRNQSARSAGEAAAPAQPAEQAGLPAEQPGLIKKVLRPAVERKPVVVRPVEIVPAGEAAAKPEPVKRVGEKKAEVEIKAKPIEVLETNLIEGEIITFFDWHKKIIILINAVIVPVFLIGVIYLGLMYYQKQNQVKIQEQAKKFNELTAEIKKEETGMKEITDFKTRLKLVSQIFAKHIYWTNFFKFLEDNTIKDIYYTGFSGDTGGDYSLDVIASRFSNIFEQVEALKNNQKITDVQTIGGDSIPGSAAGKTGVKFNLNFSILKSIFTE